MSTVLVTHADSPLGAMLAERLSPTEGVDRVLTPADDDALAAGLRRAERVVLLASTGTPVAGADRNSTVPVWIAGLFERAELAGVDHIVAVSSAMVYGAWPNNAVPLTEAAPLRPNPGLGFAVGLAELERRAGEWKRRSGVPLAVLRPAATLLEGETHWLQRAVSPIADLRADDQPPVQFLHPDDLADAVAHALRCRLDGTFNVSPDGWLSGEELRALAGARPRVRLPGRIAAGLAEVRFRAGLSRTSPGILPYVRYPWVVANDRLRSTGWSPSCSSEEAYVLVHRPTRWESMSVQRRQDLALAAAAAFAAAVTAGIVWLVRRIATDARPRRRARHLSWRPRGIAWARSRSRRSLGSLRRGSRPRRGEPSRARR